MILKIIFNKKKKTFYALIMRTSIVNYYVFFNVFFFKLCIFLDIQGKWHKATSQEYLFVYSRAKAM